MITIIYLHLFLEFKFWKSCLILQQVTFVKIVNDLHQQEPQFYSMPSL